MTKKKIFVYDNPLIKTQRFEVSIPNDLGRVTVIRKEVIRQQHNMGCTDGMKEGEIDIHINYEIYREVDLTTRQKVMKAVEEELTKNETTKMEKNKSFGCYDNTFGCIHRGFGIEPKRNKGAENWCNKDGNCKHKKRIE